MAPDTQVIIAVRMYRHGYDNAKIYWQLDLQRGEDPVDVFQKAGRLIRKDIDNSNKIGYMIVSDTADISMLNLTPVLVNKPYPKLFSPQGYRSTVFTDKNGIMNTIIENHTNYLKNLYQQESNECYFPVGNCHLFSYDALSITKRILKTLCTKVNLSYDDLKQDENALSFHSGTLEPSVVIRYI